MSYSNSIVTTVFSRNVPQRKVADYEKWLTGISEAMQAFDGSLGTTIIRPATAGGRYHAITVFRRVEDLDVWLESAERKEWLVRLDRLGVKTDTVTHAMGLQRWFTDPQAAAPPAKYKIAVLLVAGLFPVVSAVQWALAGMMSGWPQALKTFVGIVPSVVIMVWGVMPMLTNITHRWLHPVHPENLKV